MNSRCIGVMPNRINRINFIYKYENGKGGTPNESFNLLVSVCECRPQNLRVISDELCTYRSIDK